MLPENEQMICLILSGGLSTRMQSPKALLRFSTTENFLEHIINVYRSVGIRDIVIVKNENIPVSQHDYDGITIMNNHFPEKGRIYSIQLGLGQFSGSSFCFIQNIDNPFVSRDLILEMAGSRLKADCVAPEYKGRGGHPVLIASRVMAELLSYTNYDASLRDVLQKFSRFRLITDDENCLLNINFPADYEKYISNDKNLAK